MKLGQRFGNLRRFRRVGVAIFFSLVLLSIPVSFGWNYSETVSPTDSAVLTWFYFPEMGTVTDNTATNCGSTTVSPCFSTQLNTDTSVGNVANFDQAILIAKPTVLYWEDAIGCTTTCTWLNTGGSMLSSLLNTTNNVFVLAINAGSSTAYWGITSCNYSFSTAAYSFGFLTLNTSTCTASNKWTDSPGSSYFTGTKFTYIQNLPVGLGGSSTAHMYYFQEKGELFNQNTGTYSGSTSSLTGESSNVTPDTGTFGTVVPLCYFGPGTSAPC
jgi:hypothetical protein